MQPPRNIDWKSTSIKFICGEKNGRVRPGALDVNRAVYRRLRPAVHRLDRQKLGTSYSNTLTLEKSTAPGDAAAEDLFAGASLYRRDTASWRALITAWELPPGLSPRIQLSHSRERQPGKAPITAWSLHWQECPIALRLEGSSGRLSK